MESRFCSLFLKGTQLILTGLLVLSGTNIHAAKPVEQKSEQIILPELDRRTIKEAKIDTEDYEVGIYGGALSIEDFGVNPVFGARIAYHVTESIFTEIAIGSSKASKTSFEVLSGGLQLLTDSQRDYTYYNISIGYNLLSGESFFGKSAYNSDLYLIGGIGNTNFADDNHFTWTIGTGYRFIPRDWMALHIDVRDHLFKSDIIGINKLTHNIEITGGITIFF